MSVRSYNGDHIDDSFYRTILCVKCDDLTQDCKKKSSNELEDFIDRYS